MTDTDNKYQLRSKTREFLRLLTDTSSPTFGNQTQSYIKAGYSPRCATACASKLLTFANVKAEFERIEAENAKAFSWSYERWQQEIISIYNALPPTNPSKLRSAELIGRAKGYIKESGVTINALTLGDEDMARARLAIGARLNPDARIDNDKKLELDTNV